MIEARFIVEEVNSGRESISVLQREPWVPVSFVFLALGRTDKPLKQQPVFCWASSQGFYELGQGLSRIQKICHIEDWRVISSLEVCDTAFETLSSSLNNGSKIGINLYLWGVPTWRNKIVICVKKKQQKISKAFYTDVAVTHVKTAADKTLAKICS